MVVLLLLLCHARPAGLAMRSSAAWHDHAAGAD
jgi:hypothetical protein